MRRRIALRQALVAAGLAALLAASVAPQAAAAVEPLGGAPNDPRWSQQWNLAANPGVGVDVREAWRYGRGKGTVLAVVDSGIIAHPEFEGRILPGYDFISSTRVANDGDGRDEDPSDPGDWVSKEDVDSGNFDEDCKESNSDWHGTHVAGIALADADNGVGIAGIAPLAKLLPVRVIGKCGGTDRDLIDGIRWAAGLEVSGVPVNRNPADVINLSLGGEGSCSGGLQSAVDEITALGVMIVASVGNEAKDASLYSPANCFGTATVGALTVSGTLATYSNFGNFVDLAAPGGDTGSQIISTVDRGTTTAIGPGYAAYRGTSMAAPHLSGVLLIARGYDPLTPSDALYEVLFNNLAPFVPASGSYACSVGYCGNGALDAGLFLAALEARPAPLIDRTLPASVTFGGSAEGAILVDGAAASDIQVATQETCAYNGTSLSGLKRGVCTLTIQRPGSAVSKPLEYLVNIEVGGLTAAITHTLPGTLRARKSARLNATVDSGGALTYKSRTPRVCKVGSAGKVTALSRGTCRVRINVSANGDYDAGKLVVFTTVRR
jgi:subtilisin family serine protease